MIRDCGFPFIFMFEFKFKFVCYFYHTMNYNPASILHMSISDRYRPDRNPGRVDKSDICLF